MISPDKDNNEQEVQSEEQSWDNPVNPEGASDTRDLEQLVRQKEEAERRKDNLTTEEND
ncbi:hypothetical protein GS399_18020 [Pedobacter sp. HMF7647]|uniref:Uncharacterized protein n=1 Tax=Hufsiella arboris TaxID=2695275 RepID=A0A7K1YE35_9SPHI|nr:hypothetical protein [Hufsiella arboris]MXV52874.1 hypothetical protein [Hufsiella arboris]